MGICKIEEEEVRKKGGRKEYKKKDAEEPLPSIILSLLADKSDTHLYRYL